MWFCCKTPTDRPFENQHHVYIFAYLKYAMCFLLFCIQMVAVHSHVASNVHMDTR